MAGDLGRSNSMEKENDLYTTNTVEDVSGGNMPQPDHLHLTETLTDGITFRMKMFALWIALGGWLVNFEIGYSGIVLRMQPFNKSFGSCALEPLPPPAPAGTTAVLCTLSATQQSVISIYLLFLALGAGCSSIAGTYLGRKNVIRLGCFITVIGAAGMLGSTGSFAGYLVSKYIGGFGIGLFVATGPPYGAECTPSHKRGFLVSLYTVGLGAGSVVVAAVCLGTQNLTSNWSWQIPIILQIPVALFYAGGLAFFPESPRWLLLHDRVEDAQKSFAKFYNRSPDSQEVLTQVQEIKNVIECERSTKKGLTFLEIFHRKYIRRTLVAAWCITLGSLTGVNFVIPYAAIFLTGVGIKNPFDITLYLNLCILAGSVVGPFPVQYLGRRITFITGYIGMALCMFIFAVTNSALNGSDDEVAQKVLIAFLCIWAFMFSGFNASTSWLAAAEQHSVRHRTYGTAFATLIGFIMNFASSFWTPYMINEKYGNMGTNVGYFYFGLLIIGLIITYLVVPETGHLTLEEIDEYYDSGVKAWRTSLKKNKAEAL